MKIRDFHIQKFENNLKYMIFSIKNTSINDIL